MPALAQKQCTQIGCSNGLHFTVDPAFDWKGGSYEIMAIVDGKKMTCRGTLPLQSCDENNEPTFRCNSTNIRIGESGCMLPDAQHAISGVYINGYPSKVYLMVKRNQKLYAARTVAPKYHISRPNGPGCGPVCKGATHNLLTAE